MVTKYNEIWKVKLINKDNIYDEQSILIADCSSFNVDLTGDSDFNEFNINKVYEKISIKNLGDVYKYCKHNNIKIYKTPDGLLVGGEKDFLIANDLSAKWVN